MSQPFQTLFSYNKATEPAFLLSIPVVNNPTTTEDTPSASGLFQGDN